MCNQYEVRLLREQDKADWLELWLGYQEYYQVAIAQDVTQTTWDRLLSHQTFGCLVAQAPTGELVGMTHYTLHHHTWEMSQCCYLVDLYISQSYRRNGLARKLIDAVIEKAKQDGWNRVYWLTKHDNFPARKLYDQYANVSEFVRYNVPIA